MRKLGIAIAVSSTILIFLWIILRLTGMAEYYIVQTGSNLPNIQLGENIFVTRLKAPKRLDFICYTGITPLSDKKEVYINRVCGLPGDKVQIKNGVLFVNGANIDSSVPLHQGYVLSRSAHLQTILDADKKLKYDIIYGNGDTIVFFTSRQLLRDHKIPAQLFLRSYSYTDEYILKQWGRSWTADNFGPVTVPENSFFVLGDNRYNSLDSRYTGFIAKSDYKFTALK